jgi:Ser-tRNA(Ala) deacylase AlaX
MKKLFWSDPCLSELHTVVERVEGREVRLAQTIFYAFSGGQERDEGSIDGIAIADARISGGDIVHILEENPPFTPGDSVTLRINPFRRNRLMRLHFAAEIVLVLVMESIPGIEKIGAHISEEKARLDFLLDRPITPLLPGIAERANHLIRENRPVESGFSDPETEERYWKIEGFGSLPCGGTHIRRTSEIGPISLARRNIGRGKERVEIVCREMPA